MKISFEIPQEIEEQARGECVDINNEARELFLVNLYRLDRITHGQLARALQLDAYDTDGVLKRHGVYLEISTEELRAEGLSLREPCDPGDAWDQLGEEIHDGFTTNGLKQSDFEDAVRGSRPLSKSNKNRELAKRIREAKNTEPNVVLHREDIVFTMCGDERIPTLRQFLPEKLRTEMGEELMRKWRSDRSAFASNMQDWTVKRDALFDDLTTRAGRVGRKGGIIGRHREELT